MYKILTSAPQYLALLLLYFLESNYLSLQPRVVFFFIFATSQKGPFSLIMTLDCVWKVNGHQNPANWDD